MAIDRVVRFARLTCLGLAGAAMLGFHAAAQTQDQPNPGRGLLGRPSPPQPQQKQGLDYFSGVWDFTWSGRDSGITPGPRSGKVTFTRATAANTLSAATDGKIEDGDAYKETGTLTWNEATKELTVVERLASGTELRGVANWSSPIGMSFETAPMQVKGQTVKVKRTYSILSATSFSILEELSTNGGPYQRVGTGAFRKTP